MEFIKQAAAVVVIKDKKILMGLRVDGGGWSLPGGRLEDGELYAKCAKRELYEEFNLVAGDLILLGPSPIHRNKSHGVESLWQAMTFVCYKFIGKVEPNPREMYDAKWFTIDEIAACKAVARNPLFVGSKAVFSEYLDDLQIIVNKI